MYTVVTLTRDGPSVHPAEPLSSFGKAQKLSHLWATGSHIGWDILWFARPNSFIIQGRITSVTPEQQRAAVPAFFLDGIQNYLLPNFSAHFTTRLLLMRFLCKMALSLLM